MYNLYSKTRNHQASYQYSFIKNLQIFGQQGLIAQLLKESITETCEPNIGWLLKISEILEEYRQTLMLDVRPQSNKICFLCEVKNIAGYSYDSGWTSILLQLQGIFNNAFYAALPKDFDKNQFLYNPAKQDKIIMQSCFFLNGSFSKGCIIGSWDEPGLDAINSNMLFPDAFCYFNKMAEKFHKEFAKADFNAHKDAVTKSEGLPLWLPSND